MNKKIIISILFCSLIILFGCQRSNTTKIKETPTLYLHGFSGTANSTNTLIKYAEDHNDAHKIFTVTILKNGKIDYHTDQNLDSKNPIIQVIYQDNRNGDIAKNSDQLKEVLTHLYEKNGVRTFNFVAHSMGNLTALSYELNYGNQKDQPKLKKQVNIAGHFDGIIGMGEKANENKIINGKPEIMNDYYKNALSLRNNFPNKQVDILNIYGDLDDSSHSDGRVSNVSSQSLKYLIGNRAKTYQEVKFNGKSAQHSQLHENLKVAKEIGDFLWK